MTGRVFFDAGSGRWEEVGILDGITFSRTEQEATGHVRLMRRASQRMAATGMDGYAVMAEFQWDMTHVWTNLIGDTSLLMVNFAEAMTNFAEVMSDAVSSLTNPLSGTENWQDAYTEEGDLRGGDPNHPYIRVLREPRMSDAWRDRRTFFVDPYVHIRHTSWTIDGIQVDDQQGEPIIRIGSDTQMPRQAPESPQERALRLRRDRGTGPSIPRAQRAHRPRRHT